MTNQHTLSIVEKLLLVATELENADRRPFSAEDLVVWAWRKYPDTFGLSGYIDKTGNSKFPDSNRVYAEIMGAKPIRKRGFLVKVGRKQYQLTESGHAMAGSLLSRNNANPTTKTKLPRDTQQEIIRLINTKAFEKFRSGAKDQIIFPDACAFWRISPRSSSIELKGRTENISRVLDAAREVTSDRPISFEHRSQTYDHRDMEQLLKLHQHMKSEFKHEIKIIENRTDERA